MSLFSQRKQLNVSFLGASSSPIAAAPARASSTCICSAAPAISAAVSGAAASAMQRRAQRSRNQRRPNRLLPAVRSRASRRCPKPLARKPRLPRGGAALRRERRRSAACSEKETHGSRDSYGNQFATHRLYSPGVATLNTVAAHTPHYAFLVINMSSMALEKLCTPSLITCTLNNHNKLHKSEAPLELNFASKTRSYESNREVMNQKRGILFLK